MSLYKSYGVTKDRKIYGNCQMLSPDDILMFRCDEKKINWYLRRNLATIVSDNPIVAKLKFNPKGLGNHQKQFGLTEMSNNCVVCGSKEFLTRHHVIPYCYRKFFPLKLKSHNFHDVLSMCVTCHETYERKADLLKQSISDEYSAPINGEITNNKDIVKYTKMAMTLLRENLSNIPPKRLKFLKNELKCKFLIKRLTKKRLVEISTIRNFVNRTHGEIVMSKVQDIQKFVELWREHFINNNYCKYLPQNWDIKTKVDNE